MRFPRVATRAIGTSLDGSKKPPAAINAADATLRKRMPLPRPRESFICPLFGDAAMGVVVCSNHAAFAAAPAERRSSQACN